MLKRKINQYNDGVLKFGKYKEKYNENNDLLNEKEFIQEGKLLFSYKAIREQDRLKFDDTKYKIELKVNTPYMNKIASNHVVLIDNNMYSIRYIEPDYSKRNLYIFLSNYEDEMNVYISIYKHVKLGPLKNSELKLFTNAWCNVDNISDKSTREKQNNDISKIIVQKKITLKYIEELDCSVTNDVISNYKICINSINYKIISSENINNEKSLIQLIVEKEV